MTAALATLVFLATIWLLVVLAAQVLGESGGKIVAALKGQSMIATPVVRAPVPIRISQRSVRQRPTISAQPKLRAAA